jgi:hypothetical protein
MQGYSMSYSKYDNFYEKEYNYYNDDLYTNSNVIVIDKTPKLKKFALQNIETSKYWNYGTQTDIPQEIFDEETRNNFKEPMGYKWVEIN